MPVMPTSVSTVATMSLWLKSGFGCGGRQMRTRVIFAFGRSAAARGGRSMEAAGTAARALRKVRRSIGSPPARRDCRLSGVRIHAAVTAGIVTGGLLVARASAQSLEAGRKSFEQRCARCHGGEGEGGEMGPAIGLRLRALDETARATLIRQGRPLK